MSPRPSDIPSPSRRAPLWLIFAWVAAAACHASPPAAPTVRTKDPAVNTPLVQTLQTSKDPWELYDAALALARAGDAADHDALGRQLKDESFLMKLDSEEDYESDPRRLRLCGLLKALADNKAPTAQRLLVELTRSPVYLNNPSRVDLLIDTWSVVRPPPPEAVKFWEDHARNGDGHVHRTVRRLAENGTPPAIALLERKLADPTEPDHDREYWAHRHVIILRDDPAMLDAADRLLRAPGAHPSHRVRTAIVEALFDHQPKLWYEPHDLPKIPDRAKAPDDALRRLRAIGEHARTTLRLAPDLDAKVAATLEAIDARLKK